MPEGSEEKTEKPTAKRLDEARERGDVAQSREVSVFVIMGAVALYFYFGGQGFLDNFAGLFRSLLMEKPAHLESLEAAAAWLGGVQERIILLLMPLSLVLIVAAVASQVGQIGFLVTGEKLKFNIERLNVISGLRRLFSKASVMEFLKGIFKLSVIGFITYHVVKSRMADIVGVGYYDVAGVCSVFVEILATVMIQILVFFAILAVLDFAYQSYEYEKRLMMTRQEVKEEFRQREGDPKVKQRIIRIMQERLMKIMAKNVPHADVVVTNPTHYAVALLYDREIMRAPKVIAKGADYMAQKIKEIAARFEVPIVERKSLARELFNTVEIDEEVPEVLYTAVAEVLAYVYRLKNKAAQYLKRRKA